ncbi:MAG: N-formylglutamate amidohydrolase [Alphaproteobacteria bacterium]|nr:N-formylglutamate amidohydrolase [Alphaproteobacteria bacterium]
MSLPLRPRPSALSETQLPSDYCERPAFETIRPRRQIASFVFNSPHSGRDYPDRFLALTRLDHLAIRQSEDAFVDELFGAAPHLGMPLLQANFPRAYLDVNREPYELDPQMFSEPLPARTNSGSPRVAAGLGTIARNVSENKAIYRARLRLPDALMRIEGIYRPYHRALQKLLGETLARFGLAVLIDCHSMPRITRRGGAAAPDIVLGDRYGTSCAPAIVDLAETVFATAGLNVARNRPYAGGHNTRTYGRPAHGLHALQIEISRHLYMSEATLAKHSGFDEIKAIMTRLAQMYANFDRRQVDPSRAAAE